MQKAMEDAFGPIKEPTQKEGLAEGLGGTKAQGQTFPEDTGPHHVREAGAGKLEAFQMHSLQVFLVSSELYSRSFVSQNAATITYLKHKYLFLPPTSKSSESFPLTTQLTADSHMYMKDIQ